MKKFIHLDSVISGEAESIISAFTYTLINGKTLENIPSVTWRDKDGILHKNPYAEAIKDLDQIPFPLRRNIRNDSGTLTFNFTGARGCTGKCSFCVTTALRNCGKQGFWRGRSVENIVDELEQIVLQFPTEIPPVFDFTDPTFEDPGVRGKKRIRQLTKEIIKRKLNIRLRVFLRAENWSDEDNELIQLLVDAGVEDICTGTEAASAHDIGLYRKYKKMEDTHRIIERFKEAGIYIVHGFIMYNPYSTFEDLRVNAKFLYEEALGDNLLKYTYYLQLFSGTEAFNQVKRDGLLISEDFVDQEGIIDCMGMYEYTFKDRKVEYLAKRIYKLREDYLELLEAYEHEHFFHKSLL